MRMCRLLFAFTLFLPAIASAWEESFPAVSKPWDEQQVLNFILAHSSVLRAYGVVTKEYTPQHQCSTYLSTRRSLPNSRRRKLAARKRPATAIFYPPRAARKVLADEHQRLLYGPNPSSSLLGVGFSLMPVPFKSIAKSIIALHLSINNETSIVIIHPISETLKAPWPASGVVMKRYKPRGAGG
jgi:hypothetical protein